MKPSERRALREQKLRMARESENEKAAPENNEVAHSYEVTENQSAPSTASSKPYKRKEGFFGAHVRLITFIITATLVLTVLGPIGIDMLVAYRNNKTVNNMNDIDIETVYDIYDSREAIQWKHLRSFNYTDYSYDAKGGRYLVREYSISGSRLVLKVGGPELSAHPDYIQLIDYRTGEYIDVLKEDPREFVRSLEDKGKK
jgi:hypothetical protein